MATILEKNGQRRKSFEDPDLNRDVIESLLKGGWEIVSGSAPRPLGEGEFRSVAEAEAALGGIQLPEGQGLPGQAGGVETDPTTGLVSSLPAVSREDIEAQTKADLASTRTGISKSYEQRIAEAKGLSEQEQRALEGELGTRRRFSSSASAFIKFIDSENQKKIANLEMQREELLADFDFKTAQIIDQRIRDEQATQQAEFDNIFRILEFAEKQGEKTAEQERKEQEQKQTALRESVAIDVLNQVGGDVASALDALNFDEEGNQVGDFTIEEVSGIAEKFKVDRKEIDNMLVDLRKAGAPNDIISAVNETNTISDAVIASGDWLTTGSGRIGEYLFYKKEAKTAGQTPLSWDEWDARDSARKKTQIEVGGAGAGLGLTPTQVSEVNALAKQIYGSSTIKTKDGYNNFVVPLLNRVAAGETIDEIADDIRFKGQSTDFTGTLREAAQQITSKLTVTKTEAVFDKFDDVIATGDIGKVRDFLKKIAIENSAGGTEQAKMIMGQERTVEFLDEIFQDLEDFEAAGGNTNIFHGTVEKAMAKVGTVKEEELRKIATKIMKARQQYRRSMTGVAFSPGENKEYDAIFPDIGRTKNFNTATIEGLREAFRGDVDFFYSFAMGGDAYNEIFKGDFSLADEIVKTEDDAKTKVTEYGANNPQEQDSIMEMLDDYTYQEILQILDL